jgi:hypothetical protein
MRVKTQTRANTNKIVDRGAVLNVPSVLSKRLAFLKPEVVIAIFFISLSEGKYSVNLKTVEFD